MTLIKNASKALFGIGSYAIYQILLLSIISKYYGTELLGVYAFIFSVTATVFFLTNLGFRQLIVTSQKYTFFHQYIRIRGVLSLAALITIVLIAQIYKADYIWVCLLVGFIRFLESLSEINYAFFQKKEEHGFQSKLLFFKSFISLLLVVIFTYLNISFLYLLCVIALTHISFILFYEYPKLKLKGYFFTLKELITFTRRDKELLFFAFPLGLGLFFINLNLNASRVFSGIYLEDIDTAVLAASLQLALAAAPIITGICQAFLPRLSKLIKNKNILSTKKIYVQLLIILCFISLIGVATTHFIGKDILRIFFNEQIAEYTLIFSFCVLGAAFNYMSAASNLVLAALEKHILQKNIMLICVIVNIIAMFLFVDSLGLTILALAFVTSSFLRLIISTTYTFYLLSDKSRD